MRDANRSTPERSPDQAADDPAAGSPAAAAQGEQAEQGLLVVTTVGSEADAGRVAEALIQRRLAGCVQIDPAVRSYYRWQGRLAIDNEWRLVIKTTRGRWDAVRQAIAELHPYELPEIIATPIALGSDAYLQWLALQVRGDELESKT